MAPGMSQPVEEHIRDVPSVSVRPESLCIRDRARAGLRECQNLVNQFFQAADVLMTGRASGGSTMNAEEIMKRLVERQKELRGLVDDVAQHQRLNKLIDELTAIDAAEEGKLTALSSALRAGETALQSALDELKPQLHALHLANKNPVDVDDVISYGTKIGASIAAPAGWDPSQPLGSHLQPAPPEEMMRAGRLAAMGGGMHPGGQDKMEGEDTAAQIVS